MTRISFTNARNLGPAAWIAGTLILLLAGFFSCAVTTVKPGHNEVATLFGEVQTPPYTEGFHLVNPLLRFHAYDLRAQTYTWEKVHVPSQDKLKTSMDVSVTFRIEPTETPRILQETGTTVDVLEKHITPKVRSLLREAGKSVARSQDFYQESVQQELQAYMEAGLEDYLRPKGVSVEAVLFRDITLPEVVQSAVIQTKERQEQLEREKAQLRIVEQQAQQEVVQAQAREQAALSDANAERTRADAEAYRTLKQAEAQASANQLLSRSITTELVRYNQVERWNGAYPQTLLGSEGSSVLINLPNK